MAVQCRPLRGTVYNASNAELGGKSATALALSNLRALPTDFLTNVTGIMGAKYWNLAGPAGNPDIMNGMINLDDLSDDPLASVFANVTASAAASFPRENLEFLLYYSQNELYHQIHG